ncbi:MAG: hypothetical protein H0U81_06480 [Pyrinomonadaceae bacterium]|nr:hypothetical protein [Pyrinomonadaceae bacterium]
MYYAARVILFLILLLGCISVTFAQEGNGSGMRHAVVTGSLSEVKDKRRVLLLTGRSNTVDVRDAAKTALEAAHRMAANRRARHHLSYFVIAQKLNKYIRKYKSMAAVEDTAEAEFIIVFNVLEMRRSLGSIYPYGEMFVITNDPEANGQPRIVWQTEKNLVWAEEAAGQLIKALKTTRGEK